MLGIINHEEKIASDGTKSRIKTSWSALAQFDIVPRAGVPVFARPIPHAARPRGVP